MDRRSFIGALIALPFVKELPKAGLRYSPIPTYSYGKDDKTAYELLASSLEAPLRKSIYSNDALEGIFEVVV